MIIIINKDEMARPTKFTPEAQMAIVDALTVGATYTDAAGAAGVSDQTLRNWIMLGESRTSGKYFGFLVSCRRAEAAARLKYTKVIYDAANLGDWRAAMEFLKRRDRATWGDSVDVTSAGAAITSSPLDLSKLNAAELASLEAIIEKYQTPTTGSRSG
jgi:transposase-like protein